MDFPLLVFPDKYEPGAEVVVERPMGGFLGLSRLYRMPEFDSLDSQAVRTRKQKERDRLSRIPAEAKHAVGSGFRLWSPEYPVRTLTQALKQRWPTDAHAVSYHIPDLPRLCRLRKGSLDQVVRMGFTPVFTTLFVDVDEPDGVTWPKESDALQQAFDDLQAWVRSLGGIASGFGMYLSRGGFRLVRPVQPALPITPATEAEIEARVRGVLHELSRLGLGPVVRGSSTCRVIDASCIDWTRQMRLPWVVRDGVRQRLPMDLSHMVPIDLQRIAPVWSASDERDQEGGGRGLPVAPTKPVSGGVLEMARDYLSDCPAAIEGHGGDSLTFRLCCRLLEMRLSPEQVYDVLLDWNARCEPPWPEWDLWQKVQNAARYGRFSAQRRLF